MNMIDRILVWLAWHCPRRFARECAKRVVSSPLAWRTAEELTTAMNVINRWPLVIEDKNHGS